MESNKNIYDIQIKNTNIENNLNICSIVKIECGQNEGTAICIHTSNTIGHLFITCAHVIQHKMQSVILRYDGHVTLGRVIYATNKDVPYDIAVIVSQQIANIIPCLISDKIPTIGQEVLAMGFAYKQYTFSTTFGYVQMMKFTMLTTTCDVCPGFSGGPVFTSDRQLLGLTIGKLSLGTVHFVLPSTEFMKTINSFIQSNDVKILNNLESKCPLKKIIWKNGVPNLNVCHI